MSQQPAETTPPPSVKVGHVVTRVRGDEARASGSDASPVEKAGRAILWLVVLIVMGLGVAPIARGVVARFNDLSLLRASDDAVRARLAAGLPQGATADYYEAMAELAMQIEPENVDIAWQAARRAVEADPSRYSAWASLVHLETVRTGGAGPEAQEALSRSMALCPLCDEELVRWRFNYVLAHWKEMPETIRTEAFRAADMLRWRGENAEFLAEMRAKAIAGGVPFDAYRAAVDTPRPGFDVARPESAP
jgi:hypothetical protein